MFCDSSSPRRWALPCFASGALLASALLLTVGCGHKKSPHPPPSKIPQRVELKTHQRGHEAILTFQFPTTTISGTALPGISRIEVWQYPVEVPDFAVELLAEEEVARREAQALLDELGLPLIEGAVLTDPDAALTDPSGLFPAIDPFATGEAIPGLPTDSTGAREVVPQELPAAPAEDEGVDADSNVEPGLGEASTAEGSGDDEATDADEGGTDVVEDDAEAGAEEGPEVAAEDGTESNPEGAETDLTAEGVELTEEELLAARVQAARTLLRSPPTLKSSFISATSKDFKRDSELVLSLEGDEVASSLIGDRIVLRLTLPPRPTEGPEIGYLFAAKVFALNGKPSDLSTTQAILPSDTPPPPKKVVVEARADGISIEWTAEEDPTAGFRIYRRDAQTRQYGEPLTTLSIGTSRSFLDRQAIFGARYIYGVTAVATPTPLLESDLSSEHEVDYQDRFGPAIPGGLVAFPEVGRVRLLWTTVADTDVAGYEVSRRAESATEPTPITGELVTGGQYLDESVASGEVWFYSVVAVDTTGNRSEASTETEVRVP